MPYISKEARLRLSQGGQPENAGELAYHIYKEMLGVYQAKGSNFHAAVTAMSAYKIFRIPFTLSRLEADGVLELVRLEFYRRVVAPYEDMKREENGDVEA